MERNLFDGRTNRQAKDAIRNKNNSYIEDFMGEIRKTWNEKENL